MITPAVTPHSNHTHRRTRPAFRSQLYTCQGSCLHLHRLQRCHANEILLTQRNKQAPVKIIATTYTVVCTTRHVFRSTVWLVDTQTDRQTDIHTYMVKAVPAFAVAAGKHWQKRLCGAKEMHCEVAGIVTKEITHPVTVASSSVNL